MRINKFVAQATGLSRRAADEAIQAGRVTINGQPAERGDDVGDDVIVRLDDELVEAPSATVTLMLNKPVGYVCSRDGQGSPTVYDLLPAEYHALKNVGRLDKDSSGLLLLTNAGDLANELTHPRYAKEKVYEVLLDKPFVPLDKDRLEEGVELEDGISKLEVYLHEVPRRLRVTMQEGRNRQIRRTFAALGYTVTELQRTQFGSYSLGSLKPGQFLKV